MIDFFAKHPLVFCVLFVVVAAGVTVYMARYGQEIPTENSEDDNWIVDVLSQMNSWWWWN